MSKRKGESRGLDYLAKARPLAIEHLLKFFGESARHLDPKTRFLISVVTKVINFSPRGLEQYVKRALKEGASPDEVIDAVLCSYPCAGLTKVVDAIDVILDLGLPGFDELQGRPVAQPEAVSDTCAPAAATPRAAEAADDGRKQDSRWVAVASVDEVPGGGALHVVAGDLEIALFNVGGKMLAVDHRCPHKQGPLAKGQLSEMVVTCPLHGWKFHLGTGESVNHPGARVRTYPVRVSSGNKVEVLLPATDGS